MTRKTGALEFERPLTTVDVVIFTVLNNQLQVLLVNRPDEWAEPFPKAWALPGGFVDIKLDSSLEDCARRTLLNKTGIVRPYLEQLGSWGNVTRDPRGWSATHAYIALVPASIVQFEQSTDKLPAKWHPVVELLSSKQLAFDHAEILNAALKRLRNKVEYTSLPAFLLPEPFTLPQLQKVYEVVLGRSIDKSGFRTRALAANFLDEAGLLDVGSPRPTIGYRLKNRDVVIYFPRTFSPRKAN